MHGTTVCSNMKDFLHEGENNVAIVVRNSSGAGGLLKGIRLFSELKILKPLKWEVALDDWWSDDKDIVEGNRGGDN